MARARLSRRSAQLRSRHEGIDSREALSLCFVLITAVLSAPAEAAVNCHKINAKGVGQDLGGGITEARILGGGLLHGTTHGAFAITGVSGSDASIAGTVTFTTNNGTLTVSVAGTFNLSSGAFDASGPVLASTDKLSGATGNLSFAGIEQLSNGSFVEHMTGTVCLD